MGRVYKKGARWLHGVIDSWRPLVFVFGGFVLLHGPVLGVSLASSCFFFSFVLGVGPVYTSAASPARTYLYSVYSSVNV